MNLPIPLPPESSAPDALASVALLSALALAWLITGRALRSRDDLSAQVARRWTANVRNALILTAIVGLLLIWAPQLRTFALSVTAVAVAIVIATKELILCLSGSAFRTFTRAYSIGDTVQIGSHRGEIVDIGLLSTSLRESEQREGSIQPTRNTAIIPHSMLFSQSIRVLGRSGYPVEHQFSLVFEKPFNIFARLDEVQNLATSAWLKTRDSTSATPTKDEHPPKVIVGTTDLGRVRLEIAVQANTEHVADIENAITIAIGSFVFSQKPAEHEPFAQE